MKTALLMLLTAIVIAMVGCTCNHKTQNNQPPAAWQTYISNDSNYKHIPADPQQQIIVWRAPQSDPSYLNTWLDSIYKKCGPFKITVFCGSCDSSLMLLSGNGIKTYIQGNGGVKGGNSGCTQNCPPSGNGDTLYWCVNFPVLIYDSVQKQGRRTDSALVQSFSTSDTVVCAVFDTGVDTTQLHQLLYKTGNTSCLNVNANNGWNFPSKNNNVQDDYNYPQGHGATVATLIAGQVDYYKKDAVKILPVKIHNQNGESDLFSVLCGFAYAKERGAQIINASFGYYAPKEPGNDIDPSALLIKSYIKYYLTNNNILLIAAAGNKYNDADESSLFTNAGLPVPSDLRNLDNVYFYPASLAADPEMTNVIAVTTVNDTANKVSPTENYSQNVVDIGVNADKLFGDDLYFRNPRMFNDYVKGSSYATPITTGIICANYSDIKQYLSTSSLPFTKQNIFNYLLKSPYGRKTNLDNKIKSGVIYNNASH